MQMHWFQLVHQCLCLMGCRICRAPSQGHFLSRRYCRGRSARSSWFRCTLRFSKSRECTPCQGLQGTLYQGLLLSLSRSQFLPLCCPTHSYYIWPKVVWCGLKWFLFHSAQNILSEPRPNTALLQKSLKNIGIDVWSGLYGVSTLQCSPVCLKQPELVMDLNNLGLLPYLILQLQISGMIVARWEVFKMLERHSSATWLSLCCCWPLPTC